MDTNDVDTEKCVVNGGCTPRPRPKLEQFDCSEQQNIDEIATPSDLKFDEEFDFGDDAEVLEKRKKIEKLLEDPDCVPIEEWRSFTMTKGGLISDTYRRRVWPRLLGVRESELVAPPPPEALSEHPERGQVVLDVARSLKRFPPGVPLARRLALQDQLTVLILRVMSQCPELCYYQGYHDVAITLLLVVGQRAAFPLLVRLSLGALAPYMARSMAPAQRLLRLVPALVRRARPELARHLAAAAAGTMFALPWVLTWFGHSLPQYRDVVRLYDAFLCHHPLLPLYVTAAILLHREEEILRCEVDMAAMHCLLSRLPPTLNWDGLLGAAAGLLERWPPEDLEKDVEDMEREEEAERRREEEARSRRRATRAVAREGAVPWRRWVEAAGGWRALGCAALVLGAALLLRQDLLPR